MATNRQRAAADLNAKLRLEARLRPGLRRQRRDLVRGVVRTLDAAGSIPDVRVESAAVLEPLFREHYDRVGAVFGRRVRGELDGDARITPGEVAAVTAALTVHFDLRAPAQAAEVARTDAADAQEALNVAELERQRLAAEGEAVDRRGAALIAGAALSRKLRGRETGILMLETNAAAEAAKQVEVDVLLGQEPTAEAGPGPVPVEAVKEWVSQGDERVRPAHAAADSAQVAANQPFTVGGERLMHPGDTSLGASAGNVVNCRCSAVHDVDAVASARQG